jgi:hypothetical protein
MGALILFPTIAIVIHRRALEELDLGLPGQLVLLGQLALRVQPGFQLG